MRLSARLVSTAGSEGDCVLEAAGKLLFSLGCDFLSLVSDALSLGVRLPLLRSHSLD